MFLSFSESMSQIFIETITPIASVVTTNIIICKHETTNEEEQELSRDLENDVKGSQNEAKLELNVVYAVETQTGWHRAVVKFIRAKDQIAVLQFIDVREKPMNFCPEMKARKIASAQLRDKRPTYFKLMIYGLGTYIFDDEYYLIFNQLFLNQKIKGLFALLEPKANIVHECFVGDLFYKVGQNVLSFRELLIRENITYPSRVRTDINQSILVARTNFLTRGKITLTAPNQNTNLQNEHDVPIVVIGGRVNIHEVLGEGTV